MQLELEPMAIMVMEHVRLRDLEHTTAPLCCQEEHRVDLIAHMDLKPNSILISNRRPYFRTNLLTLR